MDNEIEVEEPTTLNKCLVGSGGDSVVISLPKARLSREDAINLAVWLVATSEAVPPYGDAKAEFDALYARVLST